MKRKPLLKVILLGDSEVGKTSVLNQYANNKFKSSYRRTIGADFFIKDVQVDEELVTMQIWDTVGQERFQSLGAAFYRGADSVILVYDVTSPRSYESLTMWKDEFLIQGAPNDPKNFPFIVLGNKIDLGTNTTTYSGENLQGIFECDYQVPYYETSAKDNINVVEAFLQAARMGLNRERDDIIFNSYPESLIDEKAHEEKSNCYC